MQKMILMSCLLMASQLVACDSSSEGSQSAETKQSPQVRQINHDLLSIDGELFPLSTVFSVCVKYRGVWRAELFNGIPGPHHSTVGEVTVEGGIKLTISVGKIGMWPGTVFKDITATSPHRRIQIGTFKGENTVLVSEFAKGVNNVVGIGYDEKDPDAEAAAVRFANSVVACHLSEG